MFRPREGRYWWRVAALLALALVIYLLGNNLFPLVDRDEPRYAQASRQMLESGDWITPRYLDELRLKKPILIYWLQASAMRLLGPTDFAARLPSAIAAVLTLGVFASVGPRMVGQRRALWTVFIFATMLMPTYLAKVCMTDAVLNLFIAAAMLVLFAIWIGTVRPWMLIVMGLVIGASLLTKGPPVFLFLGMTLLALWVLGLTVSRETPSLAIAPRSLVPRVFLWTLVVLGLALGVCVPWVIALNDAHPGALQAMFMSEVVKRGSEAQEGHSGPPGFYFATFWATAFPWCLFWPAAIWNGWKRRHVPWIRFCLAAVLGPWVFLEIYQTKLPHYWLPSYPFVALLISDVLVRAIRGRVRDLSDKPFIIACGIVALLVSVGAGGLVYFVTLGDGPKFGGFTAAAVLWIGITAGCWGVFELIRRRQIARASVVMGLATWAVVTFAFSVFVPNASAFTLSKRVASALRSFGAADVRMIQYKEPSLAFYQGGTAREQSENMLPDAQDSSAPAWIVIDADTYQRQPAPLRDGYAIRFTAAGLNIADEFRQQTVHVLEKRPVPATLPAEAK